MAHIEKQPIQTIAELIKWSTIGVLSFIAAGVYLKYK